MIAAPYASQGSTLDCVGSGGPACAAETAATAEQLAGQTSYLEELLGNFVVDEESCETYMVARRPEKDNQHLLTAE